MARCFAYSGPHRIRILCNPLSWRRAWGLMHIDRRKTGPRFARQYPELARLLQGDERKVRLVLWTFHRFAMRDLSRMKLAAERDRWNDVRRFAGRLAIGCWQIREFEAALAAMDLATSRDDLGTRQRFVETYHRYRRHWLDLIERSSHFLMGPGVEAAQ
jgi:hypothetical protein